MTPAEKTTSNAEKMAELTVSLLEHCQEKLQRIAESVQLTVAEFKLLRAFHGHAVLSPGELARRMDLSNSRLTRILDGLEAKKIVTRKLSAQDRRVMDVELTARGLEIQRRMNETYVRTHEDILDLLPAGAEDSVLLAMEKLKQALERREKE